MVTANLRANITQSLFSECVLRDDEKVLLSEQLYYGQFGHDYDGDVILTSTLKTSSNRFIVIDAHIRLTITRWNVNTALNDWSVIEENTAYNERKKNRCEMKISEHKFHDIDIMIFNVIYLKYKSELKNLWK